MRVYPATLAEAVRRTVGAPLRFDVNLDEFLDAFYMEAEARQGMIDEEPVRLHDVRRDAYVGAVGEHLARRWRLSIPGWTEAEWRWAPEPWFVGMMGVGLSGLYMVESPIAFRRRRIFTEAEPLRRARMPRLGEAE